MATLPYCCLLFAAIFICSCSTSYRIHRTAQQQLLQDSVLANGHTGICIVEPATGRQWYQYQSQQYFIPASNAKLFTLYAALKYLGDSLVGLRYDNAKGVTTIYPTGDPTFLHPDFRDQPVLAFLKQQDSLQYASQLFTAQLGKGWAWDDYLDPYMAPRSELPLYGNLATIHIHPKSINTIPRNISVRPLQPDSHFHSFKGSFTRNWQSNDFFFRPEWKQLQRDTTVAIPLYADINAMAGFLGDTLHKNITCSYNDNRANTDKRLQVVYSRPVDSLLVPMMKNSDNFLAEQALLMVSNEQLGNMNSDAIIEKILRTDFKDLPQQPNWVDGSGLSRYNLFTPQSMVLVLQRLLNEFGLERLQRILPTGGQGTLQQYFLSDSNFVFAKTGTLGGTVALSGFMITRKNKLLTFSILTNNFKGKASRVRRLLERFLHQIRMDY